MRVLAVNSSPKMEKSNTSLILKPFLEGIREAGAELELFYIKKLNIKPCEGDLSCWYKQSGECFQKDDMETMIPKLAKADIWILASPLYVDGMSGLMKNFIDKTIMLTSPLIELRNNLSCHPMYDKEVKNGKIVLVSNCGFWEKDNFDPLVAHIKAISRNAGREFTGALLRPHGPYFKDMLEKGMPVNDIFDAARDAGRQLVQNGKFSSETLKTISRELLPLEDYIKWNNEIFQKLASRNQQKTKIDLKQFIENLKAKGVKLWVENNQLHLDAPKGGLSQAELTKIKQYKHQILSLL